MSSLDQRAVLQDEMDFEDASQIVAWLQEHYRDFGDGSQPDERAQVDKRVFFLMRDRADSGRGKVTYNILIFVFVTTHIINEVTNSLNT